MIVDIKTIREEEEIQNKIKNMTDEQLKRKIRAIEKAIRQYTSNNFMDLKFRFFGDVANNKIKVKTMYFQEGDNIQLSHSLNNGVYTIKTIEEDEISVDSEKLFDDKHVMITKVVYPEDVQEGVINMLKWDLGLRNKVGIKSETISRHSVTFFDMDKNNSIKGYPASLLGFLDDYMKARF